MGQPFVLDENIVILAQKGEDAEGNRDLTCLTLLQATAANRHRLVLEETFWGIYTSQIRSLERQRVLLVPSVMRLIRALVLEPEGVLFLSTDDLQAIPELDRVPGVDIGDRVFVRAAASVPGAILVTEDRRLVQAIKEQGFDQEYGFRIVSAAEALVIAGIAT